MPASQLKRLKQSLRDQGITGPHKSKKQKKQLSQQKDKRNDRAAALQNIRDSFNPFELKATNARPEKFQSATQNGAKGAYKAALYRPGVTKSAGEEMRRSTLLPEMRRRNKVGGLVDRRIGEGDADMTPEEKAVQRFAREKERAAKGRSLFDLEGSDDEAGAGGGFKLTHGGKGLDGLEGDDFGESVSGGSDDESDDGFMRKKRRRSDVEEDGAEEAEDGAEEQPERKKTKKEVMEEIIAKSKMHKYERQKAKENDDDLREELDKGWGDIEALLQGVKRPPPPPKQSEPAATSSNGPTINPDRQRLLDGMDRDKADKEYDVYLKKLANEARAQPSNKSLTAEEKAEKEAKRLKDLEEKRLERMQGEDVSEDEAEAKNEDIQAEGDEDIPDEAADFGFTSTIPPKKQKTEQLVLDDEDEFALEDDLVASEDEIEDVELSDEEESGSDDEDVVEGEQKLPADEEDEFIKDILGADMVKSASGANDTPVSTGPRISYTYPCPRSHAELLDVVKGIPAEQLTTVVQRIRALYHPSLSASNKESMADFSCALVDHLSWMADHEQPMAIIEQVIRHLHSLSRTYPNQIGEAFRRHIAAFSERGQPTSGDLVQLTAIGSIYPTSDHWHQVVTPAITTMAKWLALNSPSPSKPPSAKSISIGAFLVALCLRYQRLSKRYVPEAIRFTQRALASKVDIGLLSAHVTNLAAMADLWKDKTAFIEIFKPSLPLLKRLNQKGAHTHVSVLVQQARQRRRPLELHHHKKLPIRTSIPKFVEDFNPDKHYDPDKERSDANKLQKEYKRERKGALRELRKDANFIAREQLKEKRERDAEYEKKYRRLIAEVQNEEGHAGKEYEKEKNRRQRDKKR
ncbi:putative nucleolar complex protein 14 [Pseudocercospora fuligena]|uniref:Putative nucleolar complex protein 14 n=1 Tax=Pseudocercospora fuligena TaxID=685502 RepID=A0A8H6RM05_9PEZI|nr:putative nucleolar complex protein 14 [Pseudocercospora fuligena]